jgi:acetolactate synthase-1/2/3 large subunit
MCITGNIMSDLIGQGRGQLHELPDHLATLRGLTKWAEWIDHPTEAAHVKAEAFRQMLFGRQRPVSIETPWDVFGMSADVASGTTAEPLPPSAPDQDKIDAAVDNRRRQKSAGHGRRRRPRRSIRGSGAC